ncbi:MAG TPA: response regulator [Candidatus Binatia bacterium]|nr:response regulator [Candidatus Binatia bacterium]
MSDGTVFVIDDDASVRRALGRLLRSAGLTVRALPSAEEFLADPPDDGPSCLVLDVSMPGIGGLDLQQRLRAVGRDRAIVFLTGHGSVPKGVCAMKAGAVDFLQKPFDAPVLLDAVRRALERDRVERAARERHDRIRERFELLTPREREVLALVVTGLPNKLVADRLGTSEKTIKVHRGRVMAKMRAQSLAHLVRLADRVGIRGTDV